MVVLIDNYDSFTYNLVQRIGEIDPALPIRVYRNDQVTLDQIESDRPSRIIISPGPCTPREGGISNDVIRRFAGKTPILGVCLGHQCMAYVFGAEVVRAARLMHGKTSRIEHDGKGVYKGLPSPITATRYHSLIVKPGTLPPEFEISAHTEDRPDEIMGIRHRHMPLEGVQFHPESFLTEYGHQMLASFLDLPYRPPAAAT